MLWAAVDAQTSHVASALVLLFAFRPLIMPVFLVAAGSASAYWVITVLARVFPGTAWYDPEFKDAHARPLGFSPPQLLTCAW